LKRPIDFENSIQGATFLGLKEAQNKSSEIHSHPSLSLEGEERMGKGWKGGGNERNKIFFILES